MHNNEFGSVRLRNLKSLDIALVLLTCRWVLGFVEFSSLWFHPLAVNKMPELVPVFLQPC